MSTEEPVTPGWQYEECFDQKVGVVSALAKLHCPENASGLSRVVVAICLNQAPGSEVRVMSPTYFFLAFIFHDAATANARRDNLREALDGQDTNTDALAEFISRRVFVPVDEQPERVLVRYRGDSPIDDEIACALAHLGLPPLPEEFARRYRAKISQLKL